MAILHVTDQDFDRTVGGGGTGLVDFWAPWCGPCRMIAPVLDELDAEAGGKLTIAKLNVDDNPETTSRFGVMSIPTLKLFKDGREVDTMIGFRGKAELLRWVQPYL